MFRRAGTADALILLVLFGAGLVSAFLMNDTLAVIGTPLVLLLAKQHRMSPKVLLLALAFAVTLGSVVSPIGNPQNLLVAIHGRMDNPFVEFFRYLALPTAINLLAAFFILKFFHHESFHGAAESADLQCSAGGAVSAITPARGRFDAGIAGTGVRFDRGRKSFYSRRGQ